MCGWSGENQVVGLPAVEILTEYYIQSVVAIPLNVTISRVCYFQVTRPQSGLGNELFLT